MFRNALHLGSLGLASRAIILQIAVSLLVWPSSNTYGQTSRESSGLPTLKSSMVKSTLIPGLGEFGLGKIKRGRLFSQIEIALWAVLAQNKRTSSLYHSRLNSFAAIHAEVRREGQGSQFFIDVGDFDNIDAYNEHQLRNRQPARVYADRARYHWAWDSDKNRKRYRQFRIQRDTARMVGQFVIGGMVLNRIISVIDVKYLHGILQSGPDVSLRPRMGLQTQCIQLTIVCHL